MGRRRFLKGAGVAGATIPIAGGLVISSCYQDPNAKKTESAATSAPASATGGSGAAPAPAPAAAQGPDWKKIDADHKKGVEDFLKNQQTPLTKGKGNQPLPFTMDGNVKVFQLTADEVDWEIEPGRTEKARGYNKMIPGPILRATEGDRIRVVVKNNLTESHGVHWHGVTVPNNMDGVPFVTQDPILPGASWTYEFTLRNWGTHMYHAHHNSMDQMNRGLLGAFIIDPKDSSVYPKHDKEVIMISNDTLLGFTLNGKAFPATDAIVVKKGERILLRWMNEGMMMHPWHVHGLVMNVFARDGFLLQAPFKCDTLDVSPGTRWDAYIEATEPGVWALHCHILSHAESPAGFFGMVTAIVVTE
jgi:FtsP/CotA-like multicopper oxidase with cupredoxin domain